MTNNINDITQNIIPISLFNKGYAGKIFADVKKNGTKVVLKNDTPVCVLVSPEEYARMVDELNDAKLLEIANARMENFDPQAAIDADKVYRKLNIASKALEKNDEIGFE